MKRHERQPHLPHADPIGVVDSLGARCQVRLKELYAAQHSFVTSSTPSTIHAVENVRPVSLQGGLVNAREGDEDERLARALNVTLARTRGELGKEPARRAQVLADAAD